MWEYVSHKPNLSDMKIDTRMGIWTLDNTDVVFVTSAYDFILPNNHDFNSYHFVDHLILDPKLRCFILVQQKERLRSNSEFIF